LAKLNLMNADDVSELEAAIVRCQWDYAAELMTTVDPIAHIDWLVFETDVKSLRREVERRGYQLEQDGSYYQAYLPEVA
jgi:hypothetical protein